MDSTVPRRCTNPWKLNLPRHRYRPVRWYQNSWMCNVCRMRSIRQGLHVMQNEKTIPKQNEKVRTPSPDIRTPSPDIVIGEPHTPSSEHNSETSVAESPPLQTCPELQTNDKSESYILPNNELKKALKRSLDNSLTLCNKSPFNVKKGLCVRILL
jgi:hypothetical protein